MKVTNVEAWIDERGHLHRTRELAEESNRTNRIHEMIIERFPIKSGHYHFGVELQREYVLKIVKQLIHDMEKEGLI